MRAALADTGLIEWKQNRDRRISWIGRHCPITVDHHIVRVNPEQITKPQLLLSGGVAVGYPPLGEARVSMWLPAATQSPHR